MVSEAKAMYLGLGADTVLISPIFLKFYPCFGMEIQEWMIDYLFLTDSPLEIEAK